MGIQSLEQTSSVSGLLDQIKSFNLINFNNTKGKCSVVWLNICNQYFQRRRKTKGTIKTKESEERDKHEENMMSEDKKRQCLNTCTQNQKHYCKQYQRRLQMKKIKLIAYLKYIIEFVKTC